MKRMPILKFFVITDTHHTMKNPEHRLDNMFYAGLAKLNEVYEMTCEDDVESILLHVGDVFNSHNTSDTVANIVGEYYKKFNQVYCVAGNHDIEGNNLSTLNQTKLGVFDNFGVMRVIKPFEKIMIERNGVKIQLTGCSSRYGINNEEDMFVVDENLGDISIHLVHAMLVSQDRQHGSYMPLRRIQDRTKADITVSGDFHLGFDPVIYDDKLFVNPGAIIRKYCFVEEINRMPQVLQITIFNDKSYEYRLRPITCAKKGEEVLDRSKIDEKILYDENLEEFTKSLSFEEQESYNVDIPDIVKKIAEDEKLDNEISDLAIDKITKFEKILNPNIFFEKEEVGHKLKLSKIIGHNFQSHKHTEIDVHELLTVIVGPTDAGKTTLFKRLLGWIFFNDIEGDFFIRDNDEGKTNKKGELKKEDICYGTAVFNNDMQLTRKREKGKNIYELIDEFGEVHAFENFDDTVPEKIRLAIKMMLQVVDKDITCNFNIPPKKEFNLVYAKDGAKAKIIGSFAGTHIIDAAGRDVQADIRNTSTQIGNLKKDIKKLDDKIKAFGDMEHREQLLKKAIESVSKIETLSKQLSDLSAHKEVLDTQNKNVEMQEKIILKENYVLEQEKYISLLEEKVLKVIERTSNYEQISTIVESLKSLKEKNLIYDTIIKKEQHIEEKEQRLMNFEKQLQTIKSSSEQKIKVFDSLSVINKSIKTLQQTIESQNVIISKEKYVSSKEKNLLQFETQINEIKNKNLEATYGSLKQISFTIHDKKAVVANLNVTLRKEKLILEKEKQLAESSQKISAILTNCDGMVNKWKVLKEKRDSITVQKQKVQQLNVFIINKQKNVNTLIDEYINSVIEFKYCPVCLSPLTSEHLQNLRAELIA